MNNDEDEKREYPSFPIASVGGIILDKERKRILLVKRACDPGKGLWAIPGGVPKVGEKLKDALKREIKEETGLDVEVKEIVDVFDVIVKDEKGRVKYHYVLIDFLCEVIKGTPCPDTDALDARWFSFDELHKIPLSKTTRKLLKKLGIL